MPVLYFRAVSSGTTPVSTSGSLGIFYRNTARDYFIKDLPSSKGALYDNSSGNSLLANGSGNKNMAWFVINTTLSNLTSNNPNDANDVVKGAYVLWSAGGDGIYLSKYDLTRNGNVTSINNVADMTKFDDIVTSGGTR